MTKNHKHRPAERLKIPNIVPAHITGHNSGLKIESARGFCCMRHNSHCRHSASQEPCAPFRSKFSKSTPIFKLMRNFSKCLARVISMCPGYDIDEKVASRAYDYDAEHQMCWCFSAVKLEWNSFCFLEKSLMQKAGEKKNTESVE